MSETNPTEVEKLQAFLDAEKANGLVDFKITTQTMLDTPPSLNSAEWLKAVQEGHQKRGVTLESLAKEVNEMLAAPTIEDPDFF